MIEIKRKKVLLIEDNKEQAKTLADCLPCFDMYGAYSFRDAAFKMYQHREDPFSAVILDLGLPDTPQGAPAWAAQSFKRSYPHTPVIVVTGLNEAEVDTVTIHKAGIVHVLRKPYKPEELRELLLDLISDKEARKQTEKVLQRTEAVQGIVDSLMDSSLGISSVSKPPSDPGKKR